MPAFSFYLAIMAKASADAERLTKTVSSLWFPWLR